MPYCRNCGSKLQESDNFCETCGTARREFSSKASFTGKTCPYCQFPIKQESELAWCRLCSIPHHRECWEENGGCTTFGCHETSSKILGGRIEKFLDEPENEREASSYGGINKFLAATLVMALLVIGLFGYHLLQDSTEASYSFKSAETNCAGWEADYVIDYERGNIPLAEVEIGARVIDPSWEWEFRTGWNYTREMGDQTKPVTWLVVAKDHYSGLDPHVTLLTEELIGRFPFDDSTDRFSIYGSNHWGDSGTTNADRGLRPWLNSTGIHTGAGFYQAFTAEFERAVLTTTLPNKEWQSGSAYSTSCNVFIPSTTELRDAAHNRTYAIGTTYNYFQVQGAGNAKRVARLSGDTRWYWTRSPGSDGGGGVRCVSSAGDFSLYRAYDTYGGVRPALNLKSEILVSEINH